MFAYGGYNQSNDSYLDTLAMTKQNNIGWILSPGSFKLAGHCVSQIDSMYLVLSGGYEFPGTGNLSQKTYVYSWYNLDAKTMTNGPNLIKKRAEHGCSFITGTDGSPTAIVAGGLVAPKTETNSVEIYSRELNKWQWGPNLPRRMTGFKVIFLDSEWHSLIFTVEVVLAYQSFTKQKIV